MIYLKLLWAFFQIGLFSIGGGYAALPLIQSQVVQLNGWLTMTEFADIVTLSQMTPGPIAINAASFVGIRIAGTGGALVATFGCVLPSSMIVLLFAVLYQKYQGLRGVQVALDSLQPIVVGLIASAGVSILAQTIWFLDVNQFTPHGIDWIGIALIVVSTFLLRKTKANPIYVILCAGVAGGILYTLL